MNQHYKSRHEDDLNIAISVQPWGADGDKRRYFLIEGNDDTAFRVYRESNPAGVNRTWWSVAGTIDDLKALTEKLDTTDRGPKARALSRRITSSIPRFEATEEVCRETLCCINRYISNSPNRNDAAENTDRCGNSSSSAQSQDFLFTKVVQGVNV